jgi:deoxyribonuclease V
MAEPILPHRWDVTPAEAVALQRELSARVVRANGFDPAALRTIAGIDASYRDDPETGAGVSRAAVVVLSYPDLTIVEQVVATTPVAFPYVPGLLSFREAPGVLAALAMLSARPDLLMLDGQGIAHPRRFGIACHVGVLTGLPAIGVAKSVLTGHYGDLGDAAGDQAPLRFRDDVIGTALRSKARCNPLIISVGHRVDLATAVSLVRACLRGYRLPEPTRRAHNAAGGDVALGRAAQAKGVSAP